MCGHTLTYLIRSYITLCYNSLNHATLSAQCHLWMLDVDLDSDTDVNISLNILVEISNKMSL